MVMVKGAFRSMSQNGSLNLFPVEKILRNCQSLLCVIEPILLLFSDSIIKAKPFVSITQDIRIGNKRLIPPVLGVLQNGIPLNALPMKEVFGNRQDFPSFQEKIG